MLLQITEIHIFNQGELGISEYKATVFYLLGFRIFFVEGQGRRRK